MSKKAILLHGYGNKGSDAFFPWLSGLLGQRDFDVIAPNLPIVGDDGFGKSMQLIINAIDNNGDAGGAAIPLVVGHSSGCYLALKLCEQFAIDRLILVAPQISANYWNDDYRTSVRSMFSPAEAEMYFDFHSHKIDFEKVTLHCAKVEILRGSKDPYIPRSFVNVITSALGDACTYTEIPNAKHMGVDDNCIEIPELASVL